MLLNNVPVSSLRRTSFFVCLLTKACAGLKHTNWLILQCSFCFCHWSTRGTEGRGLNIFFFWNVTIFTWIICTFALYTSRTKTYGTTTIELTAWNNCTHIYTQYNWMSDCVSLVVFLYVWRTHVCMGDAASAAGFCLSSPDQRSATQLSHLVRHRICSVLQQWCEIQAPLTTLDPPVWAACEPRGEWQGRAEKWQPTQGSQSQRAMKGVTGMEKTQAGWWRITRGEDNFSG